MSLGPEDDLLAAEYALGVLDPAERATVAARRLREPDLDAAITAWERRLAPLAEAAPPLASEHDFLSAIEARIGARSASARPRSETGSETVTSLRNRVARWRAAAIAASLVAVVALAGVIGIETNQHSAPREFVAVLQKSPDAPAFAISINIETREFTVRPVAAKPPDGKSYELWIIENRLGAPRSLGVIDAGEITRAKRLAPYSPEVVEDATYAVTLEPPGGSPTGAPSGAPVFTGKLIPVGP